MSLLLIIVVIALAFDFINGFHDAANSIATIISTRVLTPFQACLWAAAFNFGAYFIFHEKGVANTVASTVFPQFITLHVVLAGLISAIAWNLFTWWYGIPSSSSHTLVGGFAGAAIGHAGITAVNFQPVIKIIAFIVAAPVIGMLIASLITVIILNLFKRTKYALTEKIFRFFQLASSAFLSIGHGSNDAQKTMGIITVALIATGTIPNFAAMPVWVPLSCFTVIALGTLTGGWRIVKTVGTKITKITPIEGVAAETASAITLQLSTAFKIPVSTTHVVAGSVIGVGLVKRTSAVRWGVTVQLLWAWILTIPISALVGVLLIKLIDLF